MPASTHYQAHNIHTDTTYEFKRRSCRKRKAPNGIDPETFLLNDNELEENYNVKETTENYREESSSSDSFDEDTGSDSGAMSSSQNSGSGTVRRQDRQLMRPWLIEQVEKGEVLGLEFLNAEKTLIKVPWTHASRHGWEASKDSSLFKRWAIHTGK